MIEWRKAHSNIKNKKNKKKIRGYEYIATLAAVHKYVVNEESLNLIDISVSSDRMYTLVYFRVEGSFSLSI